MGVDQAVASRDLIRLLHKMCPRPAGQINDSNVGLALLNSPVIPVFILIVILNHFVINLYGTLHFRSLCSFLCVSLFILFHSLIF